MFPTRPEVECDAMQKKPSPPVPPKTDTLARRSRMIIQTGSPRYALDICLRATELPTRGPAKVHMLNVETCYLRLTKPAALGDYIEGWRVCWLGGWDKGTVDFYCHFVP